MTSEIEKSYLIFGDETLDKLKTCSKKDDGPSIFEVANKAKCDMSDQESFSYGYSRTIVEPNQ